MLVVHAAGAPAPARRRFGRLKPKDADPGGAPATVPLTTLTAIRPEPLGDAQAASAWLTRLRAEPEAIEAELTAALTLINGAVHAHRATVLDPTLADVGVERALAVRVGFGDGEQLADGRYSEAIDVPRSPRAGGGEALRPQERVAAVLGRRDQVAACELLIVRARSDLDAGREREAALQLRVGLEALLAGRGLLAAPGQDGDLAELEARRPITGEAANEALLGELAPERVAELTETLRLGERVLRRRRAVG